MKKQCTFSILLMVSAILCKAEPIDVATARQRAQAIFDQIQQQKSPRRNKAAKTPTLSFLHQEGNGLGADPSYYVFTPDNQEGFIIMSGDDAFPELIGYSESSCTRPDYMPPALEHYLSVYDRYVDAVRKGELQAPQRNRAPQSTANTKVEPMLTSKWGQDAPYNQFTPFNYPVGCVATAMAQLMYYWKWPDTGKGRVNYKLDDNLISENFANSIYDWANMHDTDEENSNTASQEAVSKLCYDCGVSVKMTYTAESSGSYSDLVYKALYTNFKYKASKMAFNAYDAFPDIDTWYNSIRKELDEKRPVLYAASSPKGGHAYVIDGYNKELFHVNWGWNGNYDGYFDLIVCNVNGYAFDSNHRTIIGIEPDYEGNDSKAKQLQLFLDDQISVQEEKGAMVGDTLHINGGVFYNITHTGSQWKVAIALYDIKGNFLETISTKITNESFMFATYFPDRVIPVVVPNTYPDGYYTIRLVFCQTGYNDWMGPMTNHASGGDIIFIKITNGVITFNEIPAAIDYVDVDVAGISSKNGTYNLVGQKFNTLHKGINIIDGRKVYVK